MIVRSLLSPIFVVFALAAIAASCKDPPRQDPTPPPAVPSVGLSSTAKARVGDSIHGKALVAELQCNRCHDGTEAAPPPPNKHCVHCHADIVRGDFKATPALLAKWRPVVSDLTDAPSLVSTGKRLRRAWVSGYLAKPHDLRPGLAPSMPRLALTQVQIDDLAAYLVPEEPNPLEEPSKRGDLEAGRRALEAKGCMACHAMSGVPGLVTSPIPVAVSPNELLRAKRLAPDLRHTRARQTKAQTLAWLADPKSVKADSAMPKIPLTDTERLDIVTFLHERDLAPEAFASVTRLPLLTRKVSFAEVDKRVFHRTCWHCHSEPDYAIGDGGPGNSGGFGFRPRGLNLSDYSGIAAGFLNDSGERTSVFSPGVDGVPRLVAALLARHAEESGAETGAVRGMPLGYAPVALEDIQLVDSWIAQGRPR